MLSRRLTKPDPLVQPLEYVLRDYTSSKHILRLLDIVVERNAYGPQIHSKFENIQLEETNNNKALTEKMCLIRAPQIAEVGSGVQVLAWIESSGLPCAVRQGNLFALTFHPEITTEYFHRLAFFGDK